MKERERKGEKGKNPVVRERDNAKKRTKREGTVERTSMKKHMKI